MKKCDACGEIPKKIPAHRIIHWIGNIGYEIINDIISPVCNIKNVIADLDLVSISDYADKKEGDIIVKKIMKKYKIDSYFWNRETPISSIVLHILMGGKY